MRDFFINSLEKILNVVVVVGFAIIVIIALGVLLFGAGPGGMNRFVAFLLILIVGSLYMFMFAGMAYLGLGIYQNTKRTADAIERSTGRG